MSPASKKKQKNEPIGGASFFFSYFVLLFLSLSNMFVLAKVLLETDLYRLLLVGSGGTVGWWIAYTFFRGQLSVLLHEYKHAILATLVGNRWKRLKLKGMGGSFHYSYTKETAQYNAFISLAPYFLPVVTFVGGLLYLVLIHRSMEGAIIVIGLFHGAELFFNLKDASPIQTDLTNIVGGYWVALGYVIVANVCITTLILILVLDGMAGLQKIGDSLWLWGTILVAAVRAIIIPAE